MANESWTERPETPVYELQTKNKDDMVCVYEDEPKRWEASIVLERWLGKGRQRVPGGCAEVTRGHFHVSHVRILKSKEAAMKYAESMYRTLCDTAKHVEEQSRVAVRTT